MKITVTYVWLGDKHYIRNKIKVLDIDKETITIEDIPTWNYDGSSTGQAIGEDTEVTLKPVLMIKNPLLTNFVVLCETYNSFDMPLVTNHRYHALKIFNNNPEDMWFGLELEYFIENPNIIHVPEETQFTHYCGFSGEHSINRTIVMEHLQVCIDAGIKISGLNAEVAKTQWEYQIGPCSGIESGDHVVLSKYFLLCIAEKYGRNISFVPKKYKTVNGSGCHINFSTKRMRENNNIETISQYIEKLSVKHHEHMKVYGDNSERMTGHHETAHYNDFTHGIGTRHTSIRIHNKTKTYIEDRRPSSSIDYYETTSKIYDTCCN